MALTKRRPLVPKNEEETPPEGRRPRRRGNPGKYEDYQSAEGPHGRVLYKRPDREGDARRSPGATPGRRRIGPWADKPDRPGPSEEGGRRPWRKPEVSYRTGRPGGHKKFEDRDFMNKKSDSPGSAGGYNKRDDKGPGGHKKFEGKETGGYKKFEGKGRDDKETGGGYKKFEGKETGGYKKFERKSYDDKDSGGTRKFEGKETGGYKKFERKSYDDKDSGGGHKKPGAAGPGGHKKFDDKGGFSKDFKKGPAGSFRPVPKPVKPALKPSQLHALEAITDRELPLALKRLGEAEDQCVSAAEKCLDIAEKLNLIATSMLEDIPGLTSSPESVERQLAAIKSLAEGLNQYSAFGDLVGQRITRVADFLETIDPILVELVADGQAVRTPPAKRSLKDRPGTGKAPAAKRASNFGDKSGDKPDGEAAPSKKRPPRPDDDDGAEARRSRATPPDEPAPKLNKKARKRLQAELDLAEASELMGPDDEGLEQEEINKLISKLGHRSDA
ncbi:MAG: hypothetical protein LBP95_13300 [Deltaproteobacteria bacterium]|jgi:hypothetical protein|nr:hypothetical protein [Deltaproteobacteria bacterium]